MFTDPTRVLGDEKERAKGNRAEEVAGWYLRLNGVFLLPSFIVHPSRRSDHPRTEADFLGLKLRESAEYLGKKRLCDDILIQEMAKVGGIVHNLAVMVEVKSSLCKVNGPWSRVHEANMEYAIRRMGFCGAGSTGAVAEAMYRAFRWESKAWVMQYVCVGMERVPELSAGNQLKQITFREIAGFFYRRFVDFPEKVPLEFCPYLWPGFGEKYASWTDRARNAGSFSEQTSVEVVHSYIRNGTFS